MTLLGTLLLAWLWALFWPNSSCADPACARQRFKVFVELDAVREVKPIALELNTDEGKVSVKSVMASGGIAVDILQDQTDVPYDVAAGYLDRADLYQLATAWRNRTPPAKADAKIYALLAPRLIADTGEALFGLMFDYAGREGFAVAPQEMVERFSPGTQHAIPTLQLRTFIHELLHALNRTHLDAAQIEDGRLTIEAPTKCIANTGVAPWALDEQPLFALSPYTIEFFQSGALADVLPGKGYSPYDIKRTSAKICQQLRARQASTPANSRWALAWKRLKRVSSLNAVEAAQDSSGELSSSGVQLRLQVLPTPYPLGYPIAVRLIATNGGERPVPLKGRLLPSFGLVQLDVRVAGEDSWQTLLPTAWYEPADDDEAMLDPGAVTEQTVPIFYGDQGWTFPRAAVYELRARLKLDDGFAQESSETVLLQIVAPGAERDTAALQLLLNEQGELDASLGELLLLGGQVGSSEEATPLKRIIEDYPETALGSAWKLTAATRLLRRPLDPATGTRAPPDIAGAEQLLTEVCRDSGVAALKRQLLRRHRELSIGQEQSSLMEEHSDWDGFSEDGDARLRTYMDPALSTVPMSIHFCAKEGRMRGAAWNATLRLANQLREQKPARVVVIGHADHEGSCDYNDILGSRRAEAVKLQLIKAGISPRRITTVTLGKRRPIDFSATPEAHALNRRVEILIEPAADARSEERSDLSFGNGEMDRAIPDCEPQWATDTVDRS